MLCLISYPTIIQEDLGSLLHWACLAPPAKFRYRVSSSVSHRSNSDERRPSSVSRPSRFTFGTSKTSSNLRNNSRDVSFYRSSVDMDDHGTISDVASLKSSDERSAVLRHYDTVYYLINELKLPVNSK
jgi:hypothetical protein